MKILQATKNCIKTDEYCEFYREIERDFYWLGVFFHTWKNSQFNSLTHVIYDELTIHVPFNQTL